MYFICQYIKCSTKLLHLNLSYMGIAAPDMVMQLAVALRRSRSLRALHFCGNLERRNNDTLLLNAFCERIRTAPREPHLAVNFLAQKPNYTSEIGAKQGSR